MSLRAQLPILLIVAAAATTGPAGPPARGPTTSEIPAFQAVSVGAYHTCALTTSGEPFCWGRNLYGQLGSAAAAERCSLYYGSRTVFPCSSTPLSASGGLTFQSVGAGDDYTCGLTTEGAAYCWGGNNAGQLGGGTTTRCGTPRPSESPARTSSRRSAPDGTTPARSRRTAPPTAGD